MVLNNFINLSNSATKHFRKYVTEKKALGILVTIKKTGCSGLSYVVKPFSQVSSDIISIEKTELTIFIEPQWQAYLKNLYIDYVKVSPGVYKLEYSNPNEKSRCGCGESFTT